MTTIPGRISDVTLLKKPFRLRLEALLGMLCHEAIPIIVFESIRSPVRQEALYARGRDPSGVDYGRTVTKARAYESAHQYGLGADLVFHLDGGWTWKEPERGMWDRMVELAEACKLESLAPREMPHVQWPGFHAGIRPVGPADTAGWLTWLGETAEP
jgi:peptidoglycan LD-endopeptidase CwlK